MALVKRHSTIWLSQAVSKRCVRWLIEPPDSSTFHLGASPLEPQFNIAAWFLTLAPLSFSPGPTNVLCSALGAGFGLRAALPFLLGTNLVCLVQTLLIGSGIAIATAESAGAATVLKWAGVLVLLYFGFRFFRAKLRHREALRPLSFREGLLLQMLNGKFPMIPALMFSLFYDPAAPSVTAVLGLAGALSLMTLSANLLWIVGGKAAAAILEEEWFARYQGKAFGSVLFATALWIALR